LRRGGYDVDFTPKKLNKDIINKSGNGLKNENSAIIEGEEILEAMTKVKTDYNEIIGWEDVPLKSIMLIKATLLPEE